jgi:hypothetical protein
MGYLNQLRDKVHAVNRANGFYDIPDSVLKKLETSPDFNQSERELVKLSLNAMRLALITSETSEELEASRKGEFCVVNPSYVLLISDDVAFKQIFEEDIKDTAQDETADQIIRLLDKAGADGTDLDSHVLAKIRYNALRTKLHGGKKF